MDNRNLGAIERPRNSRDVLLGSVQAPVAIPAEFLPDNSWLQRNFQGQTAFCGEHAGTHFQAILDHYQNPAAAQRYSPRYGAIKLKTPGSPVYDGFDIGAGTTMTAIFKWLQKVGADGYEPLENNVMLPVATYCQPSAITPAMDADAANHKIANYAFDALSFQALQQAIYQSKAVLLLIKCDNGFWATNTPTFTTPTYGHFVVADGYDADSIRVVDSADPNPQFAVKKISTQYITPAFICESGTAVDMAAVQQTVQQVVTQASNIMTQINNAPDMPHVQKLSLLQQLAAGLKAIEGFFQRP
jgi:hypothetical protein